MSKIEVKIWGRDFCIDAALQMYPGMEATSKQIETLKSICSIDFAHSLDDVKAYVTMKNGSDLVGMEINNIFKYVMPDHFYIPKRPDGLIALMCNYRFDLEHGIAVVFIDGQFKKVCSQDEVL